MLISHTHKFIFTKTTKTASTSVEVYFERYCLGQKDQVLYDKNSIKEYRDEYVSEAGIIGFRGEKEHRIQKKPKWYHHMSAKLIKEFIGDQMWDNYFKFCVIRNPYEKVLSAFFHLYISRNQLLGNDQNRLIFLFRNWISSSDSLKPDRDKYFIDGAYVMDEVIRYENLNNGIRKICEHLKVSFEPHRVPTFKSQYRPAGSSIYKFYDKKSEEIVYNRFQIEFSFFNYDRMVI